MSTTLHTEIVNDLLKLAVESGASDIVIKSEKPGYLRLGGFVNSTPAFGDQPQVVNGASDLMVELFGDKGKHARAAVGCANLPFGVAVEVEATIAFN